MGYMSGQRLAVALAGRRPDADDADTYRFRPTQVEAIRNEISALLRDLPAGMLICSAACGADLLALEIAEQHGIPCRIILPYGKDEFARISVNDRPGNWESRFRRAIQRAEETNNLINLGIVPTDDQRAFLAVNERIINEAKTEKELQAAAIVVWEGRARGDGDLTDNFRELARSNDMPVLTVLTGALNEQAFDYLEGGSFPWRSLEDLWRGLKGIHEISLARRVVAHMREQLRRNGQEKLDGAGLPIDDAELCRQEALLTSKDAELSASARHDQALQILRQRFRLAEDDRNGLDRETLGIAGGIHKRRWMDLGQFSDLRASAAYYGHAADDTLGEDAYPQLNAAYLFDRLASAGLSPKEYRQRARALRERIVCELPLTGSWWNTVARVEAHVGLGEFREANQALAEAKRLPELWELETTARQLAALAHLVVENPQKEPELVAMFGRLLNGSHDAVLSAISGKLGLALSGGGLRASFFHLGVLARLAELDVLRHVEVLSCVSGGSIVGAYYWLALRKRLRQKPKMSRDDYVALIREVIDSFTKAADCDIRNSVRPLAVVALVRLLRFKGLLSSERVAKAFDRHFYRPLLEEGNPGFLHDLPFRPADHDPVLCRSSRFVASQHNWLRSNKVPELVLNATTVNTGHAWVFTTQRMGESPWAIHPAADSITRLDWAKYNSQGSPNWSIHLSRAVAASAAVPFLLQPLELETAYGDVRVKLVDGGVHDNQATVSLIAQDCNVVLVSDASGQLELQEKDRLGPAGFISYAFRTMDTLMERVRVATFADLETRKQTGTLQGFMFVHLKAGLMGGARTIDSRGPLHIPDDSKLTSAGVNREFQTALAGIRTDLDLFSRIESLALMACGYRMAMSDMKEPLSTLCRASSDGERLPWVFSDMYRAITSRDLSPEHKSLLDALKAGAKRRFGVLAMMRAKLQRMWQSGSVRQVGR